MNLKQLIDEWLYENHYHEIKNRTVLRYEGLLRRHIYPICGEDDIENISPRDIQHYINLIRLSKSLETGKELSPSSVNSCIGIFRQAFRYAEDYEILPHNPTNKIKRIPVKKDDKLRVFTKEEQIKIENYIDKLDNQEYFVYILVLYTGLRLGEVMALTWNDINLKTGVMNINKTKYKTMNRDGVWYYVIDTPKTDRSVREIPLPLFIKETLRGMKKNRVSKYVICRNDGRELTDKVVVWRLSMLLKRIKVRKLSFHCLRHTFATRALENKMDIKTLSEILGHSDITTTLNIYTHSLMDHKKQAMRKIRRLI